MALGFALDHVRRGIGKQQILRCCDRFGRVVRLRPMVPPWGAPPCRPFSVWAYRHFWKLLIDFEFRIFGLEKSFVRVTPFF